MPENYRKESFKIAEDGKTRTKSLTKEQIKGMSKYKAQQILNEQDPQLIEKIEAEVAEHARQLKARIMIIGFILAVGVVAAIIYYEIKKKEEAKSPSSRFASIPQTVTLL